MFFKKLDDKVMKNLAWHDISVLKLSMIAFGAWLVSIWPWLATWNEWIFFVIFAVPAIYLMMRFLR